MKSTQTGAAVAALDRCVDASFGIGARHGLMSAELMTVGLVTAALMPSLRRRLLLRRNTMQSLVTIIGALIIALLVGLAFSAGSRRGSWPGMLSFFATLFLGTLAFGVWAEPTGPTAMGFPWLMFLVIAIFVGLLLTSATPGTGRNQRRREQLDRRESPLDEHRKARDLPDAEPVRSGMTGTDGSGAATAVSLFFWVFAILAIAIIVIRLIAMPEV